MKKPLVLGMLLLIATIPLFAGGEGEKDAMADGTAPTMIAAMATDVGGLGDQSFNDGAFAGLELGERFGFEARVVESRQQTDYIPNLMGLAEDGADIVFAVGFLMEEAVKEAALNAPDTYFGAIDIAGDESIPNLQGVLYREQESGFLAGIVAGLMTAEYAATTPKLNDDPVIGVVLGMFIPPVERYEVGFIQGAKYVNPDVRVLSATAGSFTDQAIGREAALAMIEQGADIIFQAAGLTGVGAIQAAREQNVLAIGVDLDQNWVAPDTVLTSALKKIPESIEVVLKTVADGTFQAGTVVYGLEEGATGIAPFHGLDAIVPQQVKDAVATATAAIIAGEIQIATTRAEISHLID